MPDDASADGGGLAGAALKVALWPLVAIGRVTPAPTAMAVRGLFRLGGSRTAAALAEGAPAEIVVERDVAYGSAAAERLDTYRPAAAPEGVPLPLLVWVHGGAFVGGAKEELDGYLRRLADAGHVVVAPRYGLAPGTRYPVPVRQVVAAVAHAVEHAAALGADPDRVVLAGDSAGAQLAAQVAGLIVEPARAAELEVEPPIRPGALRATVLCCGVYDLGALGRGTALAPVIDAIGWAYSGHRDFRGHAAFVRQTSIVGLVDDRFPPTFLTVGDADPLRPQSEDLAAALARAGVPLTTVFHPLADGPKLGHEYQFDLDTPEGNEALSRSLRFIDNH